MSSIEYQSFEGPLSDDVVTWIVAIDHEAFGSAGDAATLRSDLQGKEDIYVCMAFEGGQAVGYKLGYMQRAYYFESWRGGVVPLARRRGIARELQLRQIDWCRSKGFRILTTTADGHNAPMLILNLQQGYSIVGTLFDRGQHLKVILQKRIDGSE